METLQLAIDGMSCGHCVKAVRAALEGLNDVEVVDVQIGAATVRYDGAHQRPEAIAAAVTDEGYAATVKA